MPESARLLCWRAGWRAHTWPISWPEHGLELRLVIEVVHDAARDVDVAAAGGERVDLVAVEHRERVRQLRTLARLGGALADFIDVLQRLLRRRTTPPNCCSSIGCTSFDLAISPASLWNTRSGVPVTGLVAQPVRPAAAAGTGKPAGERESMIVLDGMRGPCQSGRRS